MNKKIFAFTLSEVLLAMTIVGVVAAMTIPTLQYQKVKKEYTARLKNFYSRMDNALLDMDMEKGSFRSYVIPKNAYDWYIEYVDPYMGHLYLDDTSKKIYYKDGSSLQMGSVDSCIDVIFDVNSNKAPNKIGYDKYYFMYCFSDTSRASWFGNKDIFFGTKGQVMATDDNAAVDLVSAGVTRNQMVQTCSSSPETCSRLLQNDQWEFKKDYPFKF
jgi:type II secretory pathway pseudopilin PulG